MTMNGPRDDRLSLIRSLPDAPAGTAPDAADVPPALVRQIADEQLVHAMLAMELGDAPQTVQRNIRAVMEAIGRPVRPFTESGARPGVRRILRRAALATAAGLLLAAGLFFLLPPEESAQAALAEIIAAYETAGDRTYRISVEDEADRPSAPPRRGKRWQEKQDWQRLLGEMSRGGKAELDKAVLYLRGARQFVLIRPTADGQRVVNGYDGQQSWLARPDRPVLLSNEPHAFRVPMPKPMATVPFVALGETLRRIREEYDIAEVVFRPLPGAPTTLQYVLAKARPGDPKPPTSIELWADPDTGLLYRVVFHDAKTRGRPQPKRITLDLAGTDNLPANWFTHEPHHDASATIERID